MALTTTQGRPVWFLYHVPKTGGQTLRDHLRSELGPTRHVHLGAWEPGDERPDADALLRACTSETVAVTGHALTRNAGAQFPGRPVREVLVLRDPVERILSHYRYRQWRLAQLGRGPEDWQHFIDRVVGRDPMTRWVARFVGEQRPRRALDAALHALRSMTVVTTTDELDGVLPSVLAAMGLPQIVPARSNRTGVEIPVGDGPTPAILELLDARTREDAVLHRAAVRLTARSVQALLGLTTAPSQVRGV